MEKKTPKRIPYASTNFEKIRITNKKHIPLSTIFEEQNPLEKMDGSSSSKSHTSSGGKI
jgi:hypothetical protein